MQGVKKRQEGCSRALHAIGADTDNDGVVSEKCVCAYVCIYGCAWEKQISGDGIETNDHTK